MQTIKNANDVPAAARAQVYLHLPDAFEARRVLYIGASDRVGGFKFQDQLEEATCKGVEVWVLEPWRAYCDWLAKYQRWIGRIVCGDILTHDFKAFDFDVVIFWHGPEHVAQEDHARLFDGLEALSKRYVIVGAPWGAWPQEIGRDKNPYQIHRSEIDPAWLESRGYSVIGVAYHNGCPPAADNGRNAKGHLVAWKRL